MDEGKVTLRFADTTPADANVYAQGLEEELRQIDGVDIQRLRERQDTQDFGATLVLILGTAAVTELARGIASFIRRNSGVTIDITGADGSRQTFTNLNSHDATSIAKAIKPR